MYDVELKIKKEDWAFIVGVGVLFGSLVSALGYSLLYASLIDGAIFGAILGLFISLLSLLFITTSNNYILPKLPHAYWVMTAMFFSFLSGFLGTMASVKSSAFIGVSVLPSFSDKTIELSLAIGVVTYIVGALLHRFVKMRNENEKINDLLLKSRITSLETQLNPHFLFNSINSVAELIHKDGAKAEEALLGISTFLRSVMKEASLVSIEEELDNIRRYVELENIRFEDTIRVAISADEEALGCLTPKFSIGLIVENAIKHGFEPPKILNIYINVAKIGDKIEINIENDGRELKSKEFGIGLNKPISKAKISLRRKR
jgi:sensor histidine kinase YesM